MQPLGTDDLYVQCQVGGKLGMHRLLFDHHPPGSAVWGPGVTSLLQCWTDDVGSAPHLIKLRTRLLRLSMLTSRSR